MSMEAVLFLFPIVALILAGLAWALRKPSAPGGARRRWASDLRGSGEHVELGRRLRIEPKPGMTAADMLRRINDLEARRAKWPEIWERLNPDQDTEAQARLVELRGPYMFAPHLGLRMLRIGCDRAIARSPVANRELALALTLQADDQIVRPR